MDVRIDSDEHYHQTRNGRPAGRLNETPKQWQVEDWKHPSIHLQLALSVVTQALAPGSRLHLQEDSVSDPCRE